jgi:Flp pilus assembly protein TadG
MQCHRLPARRAVNEQRARPASTASRAVTRTASPVATTSERPIVATTNATSNATVAPRRRAQVNVNDVNNVHNQVRTIVSPGPAAGRETASATQVNVWPGAGPAPCDLPAHSPALPRSCR